MMREIPVQSGHKIISKTCPKGKVMSANEHFFTYSGYSEEESIGKSHNFIRHPDMPKIVFKLLWAKIRDGQEVNAFVKNRAKDGGYYWVYAKVTPSFNKSNGAIEAYFSIRQKANPEAIEMIENIYKLLRTTEENEGYEAAKILLKHLLDFNDMKYNDLIRRVQAQGVLKLPEVA